MQVDSPITMPSAYSLNWDSLVSDARFDLLCRLVGNKTKNYKLIKSESIVLL
jgi:hypothetical protein